MNKCSGRVFSARKKDFRVDTFRSGGKGGQHQNKTDSGVRVTHIETGISAESREHREQPRNRRAAFRRVAVELVPMTTPITDRDPGDRRERAWERAKQDLLLLLRREPLHPELSYDDNVRAILKGLRTRLRERLEAEDPSPEPTP